MSPALLFTELGLPGSPSLRVSPPPLPRPPVCPSFLASPFGRRGWSGRTSDRSSAGGPGAEGRVRACAAVSRPGAPCRELAPVISGWKGEELDGALALREGGSTVWAPDSQIGSWNLFFLFFLLKVNSTPSDGRIKHSRYDWKQEWGCRSRLWARSYSSSSQLLPAPLIKAAFHLALIRDATVVESWLRGKELLIRTGPNAISLNLLSFY